MLDKLAAVEARYSQIEARLAAPETYDDPAQVARLNKEQNELSPVVETYRAYLRAREREQEAGALLSDPELRELAQEEQQQARQELERLERRHRLLCAGTPVPGTGKLTTPEVPIGELVRRFDYVLAEADGAAHRPLKAHAPHEPVIPPEANRVLCVVGASGFGRSIAQAAHRPERYARLAGVPETALATPRTEAAVLKAEGLGDLVFVNQAESSGAMADARALAELLEKPVLAGSLWRGEYVPCWS